MKLFLHVQLVLLMFQFNIQNLFVMGADSPCAVRHEQIVAEIVHLVGESVDSETVSQFLASVVKGPEGEISEEAELLIRREIIEPLTNYRVALVVVDFQNDFVSGSLSIQDGEAGQNPREAVAPLNGLLQDKGIDLVVYTKDWHPSNHISFWEHCRNPDRKLSPEDRIRKLKKFDSVKFERPNATQVLYPTHCVQGTWGADIDPQIYMVPDAKFVLKGTEVMVDSYSAFYDNEKKSKTNLEAILRDDGITVVLAAGLAYDICVAATLKDSSDLGFLSAIITDCSKGLETDKIELANDSFRKKKVAILNSKDASRIIHRQGVPFEWVEKLATNI